MQQRCVVPLPLPLPLPFPRLFSRTVTRRGDVLSAGEAAAAARQRDAAAAAGQAVPDGVASAPELTRLAATHGFWAVLAQQRRQLDSAAGGAALGLRRHESWMHWHHGRKRASTAADAVHSEGALDACATHILMPAGSAAGRAALLAWGLGRDDVAEARERLTQLAVGLRGDSDDDTSDDGD